MSDEISIGKDVFWLHGDSHIVATVLDIEDNRVLLAGLTKDYWINKNTLLKKINRPYPIALSGSF